MYDIAISIFSILNVTTISELAWRRSSFESPGDDEWLPADYDVKVAFFLKSIVPEIKNGVFYDLELHDAELEIQINEEFSNAIGASNMGNFKMGLFSIQLGDHYISVSPYDDEPIYQKCNLSFHFSGHQWPDDWPAFEKQCVAPVTNETLLRLIDQVKFNYKTGCFAS
ncbi:MAG: hypothetical protein WCG04_07250 [Alphaproteobacteria bacterium]